MAGIFNLFGSISDLNKGQVVKPLSRANTSLGIGGTSLKSSNQSKPKGLSFRSKSDLNGSNIPHSNQDLCNKQQECLKPNLTQLDSNGYSLSPRKELLKKQNVQFEKLNHLSPKKTVDNQNVQLQKPSDDLAFKIPLPPKSIIKNSYPGPEKLAPYYDMQFEFDDFYTKTLENEFKELLSKKNDKVVPYEDEGFESDPESLNFELPMLRMTPTSDDEEWESNLILNLPELSDDDTF
ncbi:uncharacterized protein LOC143353433 isoform X2 [Halictus rubicundus]|uniref:uncharacterized protein LOC143353433 isoform X2 n=1 Tax=Halictus rubicundus TaxID=77578 RepID=UPI004036A28C